MWRKRKKINEIECLTNRDSNIGWYEQGFMPAMAILEEMDLSVLEALDKLESAIQNYGDGYPWKAIERYRHFVKRHHISIRYNVCVCI